MKEYIKPRVVGKTETFNFILVPAFTIIGLVVYSLLTLFFGRKS